MKLAPKKANFNEICPNLPPNHPIFTENGPLGPIITGITHYYKGPQALIV